MSLAAKCDGFEYDVARLIREFDVCALLELLTEEGYLQENIFFRSNFSTVSEISLCEAIKFSSVDLPREETEVTLTLNLGLYSAVSLLPEFFYRRMQDESDLGILLRRFLAFFDHHLIKFMLAMGMPERSPSVLPCWDETQRSYIKLLGVGSTSTLTQLFDLTFPELHVEVVKNPKAFMTQESSIILGRVALGYDALLGKNIVHAVQNIDVTLTLYKGDYEASIPWPREITDRMEDLIYPHLRHANLFLSIVLVIIGDNSQLYLGKWSQIGYARLGQSDAPHKIMVHRGGIPPPKETTGS